MWFPEDRAHSKVTGLHKNSSSLKAQELNDAFVEAGFSIEHSSYYSDKEQPFFNSFGFPNENLACLYLLHHKGTEDIEHSVHKREIDEPRRNRA
jgi:hypothetical protein